MSLCKSCKFSWEHFKHSCYEQNKLNISWHALHDRYLSTPNRKGFPLILDSWLANWPVSCKARLPRHDRQKQPKFISHSASHKAHQHREPRELTGLLKRNIMSILILTFLLANFTLSVCTFMFLYFVFDHGRTEKAFGNAYVTIQAYLMERASTFWVFGKTTKLKATEVGEFFSMLFLLKMS